MVLDPQARPESQDRSESQDRPESQDRSESQDPAYRSLVVPLGDRSYRIEIGTGNLAELDTLVTGVLPDLSHAILAVDATIADRWGDEIAASIRDTGARVDRITVPTGEPSKSAEQLTRLWQTMLDAGADRRSVMVAVGGGVVGDLAGFAAATFARGIRIVQVPTTLLAMVDSSVGGKTGINLPGAKNMVGAFWQPSLVVIDTETLATLPDREFVSGLAEVIKYGVIDDAPFFDWLADHAADLVTRDAAALRHAIRRSCGIKARVVGEDERETSGRRAILNYGHTFAHAIEATAGYGTLLHGEAVAIGMQMAARLAVRLGICAQTLPRRQTALLRDCGLPVDHPTASAEEMLPVMRRDKKVAHGKLRFVLPSAIGSVRLVGDVAEADVRDAIEAVTAPTAADSGPEDSR